MTRPDRDSGTGEGLILAVETSCDETAVALVTAGGSVVVSRVASQIALHAPYGGVVPELASRNHSADLGPLVRRALEEAGAQWIEVIAVAATSGPGLASSLLVGDTTAKAMALALGHPFYSINHLEGHLLSPFMGAPEAFRPHLALVVSGGHTLLVDVEAVGGYTVLGATRDDAAGEAFDKVGKMLGLPYPGGPEVARRAEGGDPAAYAFPRSMLDRDDFEFSFSGMKTAALQLLRKLEAPPGEREIADLCASFQEAVVDILVAKLLAAAKARGRELATLSGGVSCNRRLRTRLATAAESADLSLLLAAPDYSTDNAAMIGFAAALRRAAGIPASPLSEDINPNLRLVSAGAGGSP